MSPSAGATTVSSPCVSAALAYFEIKRSRIDNHRSATMTGYLASNGRGKGVEKPSMVVTIVVGGVRPDRRTICTGSQLSYPTGRVVRRVSLEQLGEISSRPRPCRSRRGDEQKPSIGRQIARGRRALSDGSRYRRTPLAENGSKLRNTTDTNNSAEVARRPRCRQRICVRKQPAVVNWREP